MTSAAISTVRYNSETENSIRAHRIRVTLHPGLVATSSQPLDLEELDAALERLTLVDPELARVVEVRFFGGLSIEEAAEALGISPATVKRRWTLAKAWLARELGAGGGKSAQSRT